MRKFLSIASNIIGWVFTLLCIAALVFATFSFLNTKKTGEPTTIAGYRPVYVLTGSMEPFMMTDSIVVTREVKSMDELQAGDVVTYHIENDEGKTIVVTHRIKEIKEDGSMITKGDNNRVEDAYPITIENVEAKVVFTCNWVATLVHMWGTTAGKIKILTAIAGIIMFFVLLKTILGGDDPKDELEEEKPSDDGKQETETQSEFTVDADSLFD